LYDQIPLVNQLGEKVGISIFEKKGFEADDVIGTIVHKLKQKDLQTYIVTGDMDTLQLVDDKRGIAVYTLRKGMSDIVIFDENGFRDRATYKNPFRYPDGMKCVIVNGKIAFADDGDKKIMRNGVILKRNINA